MDSGLQLYYFIEKKELDRILQLLVDFKTLSETLAHLNGDLVKLLKASPIYGGSEYGNDLVKLEESSSV